MNDERYILAGDLAIVAGEEIAFDYTNLGTPRTSLRDLFNPREFSRWPRKANQISKTSIEEVFDYSRTDEARSSGDKNRIVRRNDKGIVLFRD